MSCDPWLQDAQGGDGHDSLRICYGVNGVEVVEQVSRAAMKESGCAVGEHVRLHLRHVVSDRHESLIDDVPNDGAVDWLRIAGSTVLDADACAHCVVRSALLPWIQT